MTITTHRTESVAITEATRQAKAEAASTGETRSAVVLMDSGDTMEIVAAPTGEVRRVISGGWTKSGHVNVSQAIEDMIY